VKKLKTYVITCAVNFPTTHPRKGEPTGFKEAILAGTKIHTIRTNFDFWAKRIIEVQAGRARISLREWSGKPYASKQVEFAELRADNGVGFERLATYEHGSFRVEGLNAWRPVKPAYLANHDGLSLRDFTDWFKKPVFPMAIIHFTSFRYAKQ